MIYRSNLVAPNLRSHFRLRQPSIQMAGHDIPSDPDLSPNCGFFSDDEAAILYHCGLRSTGLWLDIGARFGWTSAHIHAAKCGVVMVDPELAQIGPFATMRAALDKWRDGKDHEVMILPLTAAQFFERWKAAPDFAGAVIDGDHDSPQPLLDAQGCHARMCETACIVLHDFWGQPIRDAARWLIEQGWRCRVYYTPNGVACCWRGDFAPPDHAPDQLVSWELYRSACSDFDFARCK